MDSIFLQFTLPNATTWFYFALLLAVALFFKFSRLLSVRNWDVLTIFIMVPGLLLQQEAQRPRKAAQPATPPPANELTAPSQSQFFGAVDEPDVASVVPDSDREPASEPDRARLLWFSYVWLLSGCGYLLTRCLFDLALVRRPALTPNLNLAGLAWLAGALFVCLAAASIKRSLQQQPEAAVWVDQVLAILCHLSVAAALVVIGCWHFQHAVAGMAAGSFYLLLPYTAYQFEQWRQVLPMAILLWAVAAYRRPTIAGLLLGLAAGCTYLPLVTLPAWFSFYWKRGAGRFAGAFLLAGGLTLALLGLISWLGGWPFGTASALNLAACQPWRELPGIEGIWSGVHWAYRFPVFVAYVAFVVTTIFWPAPKNLAHLLALSAALLISIQFWYADRGGVYVLWYLPLLLLLVFRPNLVDRQPPIIVPENDWLARLRGRLMAFVSRIFRIPEPLHVS